MPASDVDRIHGEFTELLGVLTASGEISLRAAADDSFRKVLIISAASYFEHELTNVVRAYVDEVTSSDGLVGALVENKAVSRQYHTWFDWDGKNANQFFGMFGEAFKAHMKALVKASPDLERCVRAFLEVGQQRNRLAHQNFASFALEKTADEIFALYKEALPFVARVGTELRECSKSLKLAKQEAAAKDDAAGVILGEPPGQMA
jgi:hypothetical protein